MADQNIAVRSQGTTLEIEDKVTPDTWYPIKGRKTFQMQEGEAPENDDTVLDSTAKEVSLGLMDGGNYTETIQYNRSDVGQQQCHAARISSEKRTFRLTMSDGWVVVFVGSVKSIPWSGSVGGSNEGTLNIRVSGEPQWTAP